MSITAKPGREWAVKLLMREFAGESVVHIARVFCREALGFPPDISAESALKTLQGKKPA